MKKDFPWHYVLFIALTVLFTLVGLQVGIFWDNVLFVGKTGSFLYENGILNWFEMPVKQYSAHPYLCGTYYAFVWKVFGRSLLVSHLATIPIVFGVLFQLWNLCRFFFPERKNIYAAFLLICANPTLCSHCVQVGQELFILFFALYALNAILRQKHIHKAVALSILPLFSLRAMMLCAGLFFTEWLVCRVRSVPFWKWKQIFTYFGGLIISVVYLVLRYDILSETPSQMHTGYFDYGSFGQVLYTFARNCIVMIWEYLDFGQITLFVVSIVLIYWNREYFLRRDRLFWELCICALLPCGIIIVTSLVSLNPFGHHYFLLSFICFILLSVYLLQYSSRKTWLYALIFSSLIMGNFIVYPERKSQGWQNSMAHVPYWSLRRQAIQELDKQKIPYEQTASFFPNACKNDYIELNGDMRAFCSFTGNEKYVFYSSCYNLLDEEIDLLHKKYEPLFTCREGLIYVQILQRIEED